VTERQRRRLTRAGIHAAALVGLLLVAVTGRIAYRTAHAFPAYAEWMARTYDTPASAAEHERIVADRIARIDAAVRRTSRYVTAGVLLSLSLLLTSHVLLVREINRREHIERALHDTNLELESFSYSVSHDLRAPLRSIDGFSQALVEDAGPALAADAHGHLDRIRGATRRMGQLIDDLLALSKVSRAELKRERVDITEIATQIAADLNRSAPERRVTVTVAPGLTDSADPRLVRQALQNLIENAWKFSGRREDAAIEIGQTRAADGEPAFFVRDNGAGFDPEYAEKLFGPFQRLHGVSEFPGTGIGLATVQRIVHRHGGRVWADGQVDRGATFYFTLC
jgi:light-regulated signal transduction histidine kinase (bacteriophytochrome)